MAVFKTETKENTKETIGYLESALDMLLKYEQLTNGHVLCECVTITEIINQLKGTSK